MQLASVRIVVTDLEAAARFYGDVVGLEESSRSDDATAFHKSLTARGIATDAPPEKQHWGGILLHARDPSDTRLHFCKPNDRIISQA